ncbi:MAG: hypothetical protein QG568_86 [Patescibacteria group bacterium]|nr:hypothetical protein [Patescibacteria group bacterium]
MKNKILKKKKSISDKISKLLVKIKEAGTFKKYPIIWDSEIEASRKK